MKPIIRIYTDGSCHTQLLLGAWAAIIFIGEEKIILQGDVEETTHNRMELLAVIKAVNYVDERNFNSSKIEVYSDSQYVVNLLSRKEKLKQKKFITNKGTEVQNSDLVKLLIELIESHDIDFTKVKAHQKDGDEINREVDIIVRKLVRKNVLNHG
ncbi:ribonuclease H family protein [Aurantibacillus circumpalustris]|uniref:ribonuclease H family protein n=1 Tax=Aurantibacillus circumpalustris TaxID=3036359 RepID=UPI00295B478B|nr:ribonuclease H [Aurantibacillus circumpalustris]